MLKVWQSVRRKNMTSLLPLSKLSKKPKQFDAKALGHKGGLKGGRARAEKLTPEQRKEIATKAAFVRWGHKQA